MAKRKTTTVSDPAPELTIVADPAPEPTIVADPVPQPEVEAAGGPTIGRDTVETAVVPEMDDAEGTDRNGQPEGPKSPDGAFEGEPTSPGTEPLETLDAGRLESIIESLLFVSSKPLTVGELKRLLGEKDAKKVTAAVEAVAARRASGGVQLVSAAGGWHMRTSSENAHWVGKLSAGRPMRL